MYTFIFFIALCNLLYFALHISGTSAFPKPLSSQEEQECFLKMKQGDEKSRDKLIEHNLRLVAHIIKKYYSNYKEQEDLISIGTIGLIKAVNSYDYEKKTKFATYASKCIENEILMYFRSKKKSNQDLFISDPIDCDGDGNSLTLMDVMSEEDSIADDIDLRMKSDTLYKILETKLTKRERNIIIMRYGLYNTIPKTQREVAKFFDISRSYVSRIEKKAIEILRDGFKKSGE
ncbi:MAG: RNA polymerase sporulation sigma factor SigK [Oscillospiraceae bacterium]